jgi:hypothetical protein
MAVVRTGKCVLLMSMTLSVISFGVHAACVDLTGPSIRARHPSISKEYVSAQGVFIGRAIASRNIASQDDPEFYDWTIYDVEVLRAFKGQPPHRVRLLSENTSARFPMDKDKEYLLFVSHSPMVELAGKEKLPPNYVDNCGNSGALENVGATLKAVRVLSRAH